METWKLENLDVFLRKKLLNLIWLRFLLDVATEYIHLEEIKGLNCLHMSKFPFFFPLKKFTSVWSPYFAQVTSE